MLRIDLARTRRRRGGTAWSYCAHVRACAGGKLPAGLDGWIDSRRSDGKRHTDQGAPSPTLHDRLAILIGRGIVRERGAREFPHQCDVRRHRVGVVGEHGAQNRRTDTGTFRHRDAELRARSAVLVAYGGNAGGAPCLDGEITPELSEGGDAEKSHAARGLASMMSRI
jgi:hypothetical protein